LACPFGITLCLHGLLSVSRAWTGHTELHSVPFGAYDSILPVTEAPSRDLMVSCDLNLPSNTRRGDGLVWGTYSSCILPKPVSGYCHHIIRAGVSRRDRPFLPPNPPCLHAGHACHTYALAVCLLCLDPTHISG
jgi:hypothetical protein